MKVNSIIKNKPYLAWYVKNPDQLSEESVLEHVLNYGDWDDVQQFIKIKGLKQTVQLFNKTLAKKRVNYSHQIRIYFQKYFNKHA